MKTSFTEKERNQDVESTGKLPFTTSTCRSGGRPGCSSKVRKRKSRAKPKPPIKELSASKLNFMDVVQQHTGLTSLQVQAPASSSSAYNGSPACAEYHSRELSAGNSITSYASMLAQKSCDTSTSSSAAHGADLELITNSKFILLASVLLRHLTSELYSKYIVP